VNYDTGGRQSLDQNALHSHALRVRGQQRRLLLRKRSQQARNVELGHAINDVGGN
jgi:hypothetical protein